MHDTVIPTLSPSRRTFPTDLARRMERRKVFAEAFVRDLETFIESLERQVEDETHLDWLADENHVRGGYERLWRTDNASMLAAAARELNSLRELVSIALDTAHAVTVAEELLSA